MKLGPMTSRARRPHSVCASRCSAKSETLLKHSEVILFVSGVPGLTWLAESDSSPFSLRRQREGSWAYSLWARELREARQAE